MRVTVVGCGYVGLVTATCLAAIGHTVRGIEKDRRKLQSLLAGHCPLFEPGLAELMYDQCSSGSLSFGESLCAETCDADVIFLAVGTPPCADGTVNLSYLEQAAGELKEALASLSDMPPITVAVKSTVPPGTCRRLAAYLNERAGNRVLLVHNPEFLREGSAVKDFMEPDRIVVGGQSTEAFRAMRRLYDPIVRREEHFLTMGWESSELSKYAANAMLAARISFMNELSILCEGYGADIEDIRRAIGADQRIGPAFLRAGCGFGGSCFPKDVAALGHISRAIGHESMFVSAIQTINRHQKERFARRVMDKLGRPVSGATIAVWGLAFKADTDDIRESPALDIIRIFLDCGARVRASDPRAMDNMRRVFGDAVEWMADPVQCATGADAVVLLTDWPQYTTLPFRTIAAAMNRPIIFDGRNCLNREVMRESGFTYYPIGRPPLEDQPSTVPASAVGPETGVLPD